MLPDRRVDQFPPGAAVIPSRFLLIRPDPAVPLPGTPLGLVYRSRFAGEHHWTMSIRREEAALARVAVCLAMLYVDQALGVLPPTTDPPGPRSSSYCSTTMYTCGATSFRIRRGNATRAYFRHRMSHDFADFFDAVLTLAEARALMRDPTTPADLYAQALRVVIRVEGNRKPFRTEFIEDITRDVRSSADETLHVLIPWLGFISGLMPHPAEWLAAAPLTEEHLRRAESRFAENHHIKPVPWMRSLASAVSLRVQRDEALSPISSLCIASLERLTEHLASSTRWESEDRFAMVEVLKDLSPARSWPIFDRLLGPDISHWMSVAEYAADPDCVAGNRVERILALRQWSLDQKLILNPALPGDAVWEIFSRYLAQAGDSPELVAQVASGREELLRDLLSSGRSEVLAHAVAWEKRMREPMRSRVAQEALIFLKQNPTYSHEVGPMALGIHRVLGDAAGEMLVSLKNDLVAEALVKAWRGEDSLTLRALLNYPRLKMRTSFVPNTTAGIRGMSPEKQAGFRNVVIPVLLKDKSSSARGAAAFALSELRAIDAAPEEGSFFDDESADEA